MTQPSCLVATPNSGPTLASDIAASGHTHKRPTTDEKLTECTKAGVLKKHSRPLLQSRRVDKPESGASTALLSMQSQVDVLQLSITFAHLCHNCWSSWPDPETHRSSHERRERPSGVLITEL